MLLASAACLAVSSTARAITIDEFDGDSDLLVSSSTPTATSSIANDSAIGGVRVLEGVWVSGRRVRVETTSGIFNHSQEADTLGRSRIIWNGTKSFATDKSGLATGGVGIDLTKDGGTDFDLHVYSLDLTVDVTIEVYDASSPEGKKVSVRKERFTGPLSDVHRIVPFSSFTQKSDFFVTGPANFKNIGAIVIIVDGMNPAVDFTLESVRTNGQCIHVPKNGFILDECNVCNGDNKSCADCKDVPNGPAVPGTSCDTGDVGQCKDGKYDDDCKCKETNPPTTETCDSIDNNCDGSVDENKDVCGICGGDGKSCTDCLGVPFGTTKVDKCGVCGGNNTTCLECNDVEIRQTQVALDGTAKKQEKLLRKAFKSIKPDKLSKATQTQINKILTEAHRLQVRNWIISWTLPSIIRKCGNKELCIETSHQPFIDEYRFHSNELLNLSKDSAALITKLGFARTAKNLLKAQQNLYNESIQLSNQVPATTMTCG